MSKKETDKYQAGYISKIEVCHEFRPMTAKEIARFIEKNKQSDDITCGNMPVSFNRLCDPFMGVKKEFERFAEAAKKAAEYAKRPKCYISGAIAHHDLKERMDAFGRAAIVLEKAGYKPVNPFNNGVPQSEHWTKHMRRDIGLLVGCECIYMLKGWELSKGAKLELDVASSCGIKVMFEH